MSRYSSYRWSPYVTVAERRRRAAQKVAAMKKQGHAVSPVEIAGNKITTTFWGNAWCKNLERYSDYENRLPRGRTYVRNGSVIDLQIEAGWVHSLVSGSEIYEIGIEIRRLTEPQWKDIKGQCLGQIGTLVELLRGSISKGVMEAVTRDREGMFPSPAEISISCSCPDWATMCKHAAATLYGIGARLDSDPELLFTLRGVDPIEMVDTAVVLPNAVDKECKGRMLETDQLSSLFGIDIEMDVPLPDQISIPSRTTKKTKRTAKTSANAAKTVSSTRTKKKTAVKPTKKSTTKKTAVRKPATAKKSNKKSAAQHATLKRKKTAKKSAQTANTVRKGRTKKKIPSQKLDPKG